MTRTGKRVAEVKYCIKYKDSLSHRVRKMCSFPTKSSAKSFVFKKWGRGKARTEESPTVIENA